MSSIAQLVCRVHGGTLCDHHDGVDALDSGAARRLRRRVRHAAQSVLWRESSIERVRHCGRHLSQNAAGVQVRVTATPDGRRAGYAGLQTCGSVWACPTCSARVLAHRQGEVARAVDAWLGSTHGEDFAHPDVTGGKVAMATFTVRHHAGQSAREVWDAVTTGWTGVTTGESWQDTKARYGVAVTRTIKSGPRKGAQRTSNVLPWLRATEVTHGSAGWHVHLHVVLFLPGTLSDDGLAALYDGMWSRWNSALVAAGFDGGLQVNSAKFLTGREVSKRLSDYVTKNTYTDAPTAAALEVARGDLKDGRFGNRSAMQLLRDVVLQPDVDQVPADVALWHEYEKASAGRRQMTWAVGARDLLGLGAEKDDQAIVETEEGTADDAVVNIPGDSWATLRAIPGRRTDLLDAVERSTAEGLALLASWGIDHELITHDELAARRRRRAGSELDPRQTRPSIR